jgi:uncharacterized membrane protein YgaE (UPF0421/DUF939 family)
MLSALLAVGPAAVFSLDELPWAAFSGIMTMPTSLAETVPRDLMRIAGTVVGTVLGLLVAPCAADC